MADIRSLQELMSKRDQLDHQFTEACLKKISTLLARLDEAERLLRRTVWESSAGDIPDLAEDIGRFLGGTVMAEIEHDLERGVFRRKLSSDTYVETDDTCSVCGEKSDEPIICSRCEATWDR